MYMVDTYLLIHHKNQPDLGKYTSPMDPMYLPQTMKSRAGCISSNDVVNNVWNLNLCRWVES